MLLRWSRVGAVLVAVLATWSAVAETVVVAERTSFRFSELKSFEGPYSDAKALALLYGSYNEQQSSATWKGAGLKGDCGSAADARVRVALSEDYPGSSDARHVLVTKATPVSYRAEDGGRTCAPLLGVAIFIEHEGRWYARRDHERLIEAGEFGEPPKLGWLQAGPSRHALLITDISSQDVWHYGYQLLDVDTEHPRRVLQQSVDWESDGDRGLKSDISVDTAGAKEGQDWYDLEIWSQQVTGGGSLGPLKPVAGTLKKTRFAYVQGLYRLPGARPAGAVPVPTPAKVANPADYAQRYAAKFANVMLPGGACDSFRVLITRTGNATQLPVNVRVMQIDSLVNSADRIRCIPD